MNQPVRGHTRVWPSPSRYGFIAVCQEGIPTKNETKERVNIENDLGREVRDST